MSVINKMLLELDRRNAMAGAEAAPPPQQVKVIAPARDRHEWFWRMIALLVFAALAWVGWVAYQLQPRAPLVTEKALRAQAQARKPAVAAIPPAAAQPAAAQEKPKPAAERAQTFKLAREIETPIAERAPQPPKAQPPKKPQAKAEARIAAAPAALAAKPSVDKRDRGKANEPAEMQFRRAAVLLNQGRVSEAEEQLVGALQADPAHQAARQAYVALLLEQGRIDAAKRVLREALDADPGQPTFALALARIYAGQGDYPAALDVMDRAGPVAQNADFEVLRGAVLQRLGRHAEAVDAYRRAVQGAPQSGNTWAGLGISLEALGRKAQAAEAFRRALGAGPLNKDVREYAETRLKALE